MAAFNIYTFALAYSGVNKYSIDTEYYSFNTPSKQFFKELFGGNKKKIRLLEIEMFIQGIGYSVGVGERPERYAGNFYGTIPEMLLEGVVLKEPTFGSTIQPEFNNISKVVNFGEGIIIDDFKLPLTISLKINDLPPVGNNPTSLFPVFKIKFNQNYSEQGHI